MNISDIIIILSTLIFSAFFSGMEIAYTSSNKLKIEIDKKSESITSKIISRLAQSPAHFIGTMLVGNNIALVFYGIAFSSLLSINFINGLLGINSPYIAMLFQTTISTLLILFLAEFLPKNLFRINPNKVLFMFAIPLQFLYYLLYPIVYVFKGLSEILLKTIANVKINEHKQVFTVIDLDHFVREISDEHDKESDIVHDIQLFKNAMDFRNVKLRDCMIPRNEIIAVDINTSIDELQSLFISSELSKILIYNDSPDNIVGYVHILELFNKPKDIKRINKPVLYAPESMAASELLNNFIREKKNVAVVVDEFGGTAGMLTIEDVIEEIFGEIEDEFDTVSLVEKKISNNEFLFSGRVEVDYINQKYKLHIPESEDYNTLAGFILNHNESLPEQGEVINIHNFTFRITQVSNQRIEQVVIIIGH